ncbi:MAG: tail fiber domain-containing protein [Parcubacteria group bacterium]|jgi:hypothetical protein
MSTAVKDNLRKWLKVTDLEVGMKIAVPRSGVFDMHQENYNLVSGHDEIIESGEGDILWDEIVSIESVGVEQVWDIEVEGTHNFVAGHLIDEKTGAQLTEVEEKKILDGEDKDKKAYFGGIYAHNTYISGGLFLGANSSDNFISIGSTGASSTTMYIGNRAIATVGAGGTITGTQNYISKFTADNVLGNSSVIYETGGNIGIGTTNPGYKLEVVGTLGLSGQLTSTVVTGTAPFVVASTTKVTNLNADQLDGHDDTYFQIATSNIVIGTGTQNYIPKFTGAGTIGNSLVYDTGTYVGIGLTNPTYQLQLSGTLGVGSTAYFASNVGIGTTAPASKLDVVGVIMGAGNKTATTNKGLSIAQHQYDIVAEPEGTALITGFTSSTANNVYIGGGDAALNAASTVQIYTGAGTATRTGTQRLLVDSTGNFNFNSGQVYVQQSNGNVGIGTTSPGQLLSVFGSAADLTTSLVSITNNAAGSAGIKFLTRTPTNGGPYTSGRIMSVFDGAGFADARITLQTPTAADTWADVLTLKNGNVGIGTTGPVALLHLAGSGNPASPATSGSTQSTGLRLRIGSTPSAGSTVLDIGKGSGGGSWLQATDSTNLGSNYDLLLNPNGGNVGIGTTGPGAKLDVNGTSIFRSLATFYGNGGLPITWGDTSGIGRLTFNGTTARITTSGGTNDLGLGVNGGENITIQATSGNVGIGTTTPLSRFVVKGSTADSSASVMTLSDSNNASLVTVLNNGNVGIGTTSPGAKLEIDTAVTSSYSPTALNTGGLKIRNIHNSGGTDQFASLTLFNSSNNGSSNQIAQITALSENINNATSLAFQVRQNAGTYIEGLRINSTGNVGIGTTNPLYKLDVIVAGTGPVARFANASDNSSCAFGAGGVLTCTSDARLKKNITAMDYGLDTVLSLKPVEFDWKNQKDSTQKTLGFIAQDVEAVMPQLVITDANGYKELNTIGMMPVLVKAIQEQEGQITNLQSLQTQNFASLQNQLGDINLSTSDKITLIGQNIDTHTSDISQLQNDLDSLKSGQISHNSAIKQLQDQMALIEEENQTLIDFAKVFDPKAMVTKNALGNIDILDGKITAKDIEALNTIYAKDIVATGNVAGASIEIGTDSSGKGTIKAGETEVRILTPNASDSAKISITPRGDTFDKVLFYEDIVPGVSFKVKIKKATPEGDINFDWFIIK